MLKRTQLGRDVRPINVRVCFEQNIIHQKLTAKEKHKRHRHFPEVFKLVINQQPNVSRRFRLL